MSLYNDYDVDDILFDLPCNIGQNLSVYPVRVSDYKRFTVLSKYLLLGKEHLGLESDKDVFMAVIQVVLQEYMGEEDKDIENCFTRIIGELEELFSILTRQTIVFKQSVSEKIIFTSQDKKMLVSEYNYSELRQVVMLQNLLHEPKVYKNKIVAEWAERVKKARQKKSGSMQLFDIINIVSVGMNIKYGELYKEMNVFQLYSYFARLTHEEEYKATILFKTVSDKVPNVDYTKSVISEIMKNPDDDLFKESSTSKLGNML